MNYDVITNRPDAVEVCGRLLQRYFGGANSRFPEEVKDLPLPVRRQANRAVEAFGKYMQSPDRRSRDRVKQAANSLQESVGHKVYGVVQPVLASCACAVSRSWKKAMIEACTSAIELMAAKCGPASAGAIELQCQAMELSEIAGCRLRDVVSLEHDDIEELEGFLDWEADAELAAQVGKKANQRD